MDGKNLLISNEAHKILKLFCVKNEFNMGDFASISIIEYINFCEVRNADEKEKI